MLPFLAGALLLALPGFYLWALAAAVAGLLVLLFFRIPGRSFQGSPDTVVAPAAGRVMRVDQVEDPEVGPGLFHRVVTFLSVLDVHVQNSPVAGEVIACRGRAGRKIAAFRPAAGDLNENHLTVIRRPGGDCVGVRQIAGVLARRVVCYLRQGDEVERGQSLGIIKFGSRVDLLLPPSYRLLVAPGDHLKNGATPVAEVRESQ